jgi:hypothetical protein
MDESNAVTETLASLNEYKIQFEKQIRDSLSKKERLESLLSRSSTLKLTSAKRQRLIRRLQSAKKQYEESENLLDQVKIRIGQVQQ